MLGEIINPGRASLFSPCLRALLVQTTNNTFEPKLETIYSKIENAFDFSFYFYSNTFIR